MTTHDIAAGQILFCGIYGTTLSQETVRRLEAGRMGGVILMGRNVEAPEQVRSLLMEIVSVASSTFPPPLLGVDQEGGRVARLRAPLLPLPSSRRIGELDDPRLTRLAFQLLGQQLRGLGFTVDFAPVLDVDGGDARAIIGDRSFSGDPVQASLHGVEALGGLIDAGICPCGKHFPGHGATIQDSHEELPRVSRTLEELSQRELRPFVDAIEAGLPLLMPAHVIFEAYDGKRPATISEPVLTKLLREQLGYRGAVITDDLKMGAVVEAGGAVDVALEALMAGADLLLCCHDEELQESIRGALVRAAEKSESVSERLQRAASRAVELRRRFRPDAVASEELTQLFDNPEILEISRVLEGKIGNKQS